MQEVSATIQFDKDKFYYNKKEDESGILKAGTIVDEEFAEHAKFFDTEGERNNYRTIIKGYIA